jgi:hypothetical protein
MLSFAQDLDYPMTTHGRERLTREVKLGNPPRPQIGLGPTPLSAFTVCCPDVKQAQQDVSRPGRRF